MHQDIKVMHPLVFFLQLQTHDFLITELHNYKMSILHFCIVYFREFRSLSTTEENNEWAHVNKDEPTKSENLNVDECRDSNNSDISSSFSDEEDRLTEYPSVTLVAYVNSGEHDSGVSSNTEKSSSPELLKPNSSQRTSETIHSDTTNVQVDFENDHQVSDNFSINTTKR